MRKFFVAGAAFAVLIAQAAFADARSEVAQAAKHVELALMAGSIEDVHHQVHQALNCLVGPNAGHYFDPTELNPCAHMGKGAILDTKGATQKKLLSNASDLLYGGAISGDPLDAKVYVRKAQPLLQAVK